MQATAIAGLPVGWFIRCDRRNVPAAHPVVQTFVTTVRLCCFAGFIVIGAAGFEPATPCSQSRAGFSRNPA